MKKFILYFLLAPQLVFAQTTMTGTVMDEKRNPVPFANIFLKPDNSHAIVGYGQSDGMGNYMLSTIKTGKMWLNFSAMSYKTVRFSLELSDSARTIKKNATMVFEPIAINEVIVSADKSMVIKKDTIIFNVKAFAKGNERVLEDLLKKIPGLTVLADGTIKVGNRDIEKIMIDGDDFFEKGYRILSKNMPAYPIEKVEVYQHYSNNKLLKGIESSDKVALNLKLDEKSKRLWFGNIAAGLDPINRKWYEGNGNLMNFGKKNKFYGITNLNNTGEDATGDINFLIKPTEQDEPGSLGENQNAPTLIDISTFSPNLKENRIRFNNTSLYSLNGIFTLSSKVKMKALLFLNKDINNFYKSNFESVSIGETTFTNTEDHSLKKIKMTRFGKIDLTDDISKNKTLVYTLKFNQSEENSQNRLIFNDSVTNEKLQNANILLDQKIVYTNKFKNNKVWLLTGRYIYEQLPQNYSLDKFIYRELFPGIAKADEVIQTIGDQMHYAGFEAHLMDRRAKGNLLEIKIGNQFRSDNLTSGLSLKSENSSLDAPSGYHNDLLYSTNDAYFKTEFRIGRKSIAIISSLDFHQLFNQLEKPGSSARQNPLFINPKAGMEWKINAKNKILATYSYNRKNGAIIDVYDQYINTGFRSFTKGTGNFNQLSLSSAFLNYNYGSWGEKSFANAFLIYGKNHDYFSNKMIVSQNYAMSEKILIKNKIFILFSANFDRYLKLISSTLKLNVGFSKSNYENTVNGSDFRKITTKNLNGGFELRSGFESIFNYHFGSKWTYIEIITNSKANSTDNLSFLDLSFSLNKKIEIQLESERYYFGSLDNANNKYYFLDLDFRYTVKENKLSFTLSGQNLLDTKTFRSFSIDDISISRTEFRLLPRYLLLKAEYRF